MTSSFSLRRSHRTNQARAQRLALETLEQRLALSGFQVESLAIVDAHVPSSPTQDPSTDVLAASVTVTTDQATSSTDDTVQLNQAVADDGDRRTAEISTFNNSEPPCHHTLVMTCDPASSNLTYGDFEDTGGMVNLHNGSVKVSVTDLVIPGRGLDWEFSRTYRSDVNLKGPLGYNWSHNSYLFLIIVSRRNLAEVQATAEEAQVGDILRFDGAAGRADLYVKDATGHFITPGFFTTLEEDPDGGFTERDPVGNQRRYAPPAPGDKSIARIESRTDRNGNTMRFEYDKKGNLKSVLDTLGREIQYSYDGDLLTAVRDFSGRTISFAYDDNDDLVAVTSPAVTGTPHGNDFPDGATTTYSYSSGFANPQLNHNLLTITAPNEVASGGPPWLVAEHDGEDRVKAVIRGGFNAILVPAGGVISYEYEHLNSVADDDFDTAVSRTTVTDRNGNVTRYLFNQSGNIRVKEELANRGLRAGEPSSFVTEFKWDRDGVLREIEESLGNTVEFEYDSGNPNRLVQGNVLEQKRTPDSRRGGDQTSIRETFTHEPLFNQVLTSTDPRGNDPTFVPHGAFSHERYHITLTYDYQEGTDYAGLASKLGRTSSEVETLLLAAGVSMDLGDVNGDGRTDQINGNLIRVQYPTVTLLPGSNQALVEGDTEQESMDLFRYNGRGQLDSSVDSEGNVTEHDYYPEQDPNGDGVIDNPVGDPVTGGYLKQITVDTKSDPARNSGTNPPPVEIRKQRFYDEVGNVIREVDGRGIASDFHVNQWNQVVQITHAAAHDIFEPDPIEPLPPTDYRYLERIYVDFNGVPVLTQVEDRGNTSNVDGSPPALELRADVPGLSDPDPVGEPAFVDTVYVFDILDNLVQMLEEVTNGGTPEFRKTRWRYDGNEHKALTIAPAGNATSWAYDERDLLLERTVGALSPPPLALLAAGDPTDYDARGGLAAPTTYHYDKNRNLIETVDADDTDLSPANDSDLGGSGDRTRRTYDGYDRETSIVDSTGNQTVIQYDPRSNVVRMSRFGPVGGPSPTSDGPDTLPVPVSSGGVIQSTNLVNPNPLKITEYLHNEKNQLIQTDRVLFVNTIPTVRIPDVADGATDLGKGHLTPGDNQAVPGINGITILGRVSTRREYDRASRPTHVVEDDGDTYRTLYDGSHRPIMTVDPEGNTHKTAYDDNGNVIETARTDVAQIPGVASQVFLNTYYHDANDRLTLSVDNMGQATRIRHDSRGNDVAIADAQGPLAGATITRRAFPDGPRTINVINDPGNVSIRFYDGINRLTREEIVLTEDGEGDGVHIGASIFGVKNDPSAPESFTTTPDPSQGGGDGLIRSGTIYDANSLVAAQIDDQGNVTVNTHDNHNRQVTKTGGLTVNTPLDKATILGSRGIVTPSAATINNPTVIPTSAIDAQLALTKIRIDAVANLFPSLADEVDDPTTEVYGFGPDGNVLIREDENDTEFFTLFDADNRAIAKRVFRAGQADSHVGDPVFAPAPGSDSFNPGIAFPAVIGTTKQNFEYNGLSGLVFATDNNNPADPIDDSTITYAYDSLSRVIEETQQIGALQPKAIGSAWRAENLRKQLIYPNGRQLEYGYDGNDQLTTIARPGTSPVPIPPLVTIAYIGQRVLERGFANGTRETYLDDTGRRVVGYDGLGRPEQIRHLRSDNTLIVGAQFTFDRMDNKLTEHKLHDSVNSEAHTYDSHYRLIDFDRPNLGAIEPLHSEWMVDGVGNWTQVETSSGTETRQHSSFNELVERANGAVTRLDYDDNGNQTDAGEFTFEWDAWNRLSEVTRKSDGKLVARYSYDAPGRRTRKEVTNSGTLNGITDFYYDGRLVIEERAGADQLTRQYVATQDREGDGTPDWLDTDSDGDGVLDQRFVYHQDPNGSVVALTDDTGRRVEGYVYDAYGRQTVYEPGPNGVVDFGGDDVITPDGSSTVGNPYTYLSQSLRHDTETDLYFNVHSSRYYEPEQGRFLSRGQTSALNADALGMIEASNDLHRSLGLVRLRVRKSGDATSYEWQEFMEGAASSGLSQVSISAERVGEIISIHMIPIDNSANGQQLFMQGKLKTKGDMGLARNPAKGNRRMTIKAYDLGPVGGRGPEVPVVGSKVKEVIKESGAVWHGSLSLSDAVYMINSPAAPLPSKYLLIESRDPFEGPVVQGFTELISMDPSAIVSYAVGGFYADVTFPPPPQSPTKLRTPHPFLVAVGGAATSGESLRQEAIFDFLIGGMSL